MGNKRLLVLFIYCFCYIPIWGQVFTRSIRVDGAKDLFDLLYRADLQLSHKEEKELFYIIERDESLKLFLSDSLEQRIFAQDTIYRLCEHYIGGPLHYLLLISKNIEFGILSNKEWIDKNSQIYKILRNGDEAEIEAFIKYCNNDTTVVFDNVYQILRKIVRVKEDDFEVSESIFEVKNYLNYFFGLKAKGLFDSEADKKEKFLELK